MLNGVLHRAVRRRGAATAAQWRRHASSASTSQRVAVGQGGGSGEVHYGFSFSGCGWLLPYHAGVAQCLLDGGAMPGLTSVAARRAQFVGASGGALMAAAMAFGVTPQEVMDRVLDMNRHCRRHGTVWKLETPLESTLRSLVPDDAMERLAWDGSVPPRVEGTEEVVQERQDEAEVQKGRLPRPKSRLGVAVTNCSNLRDAQWSVSWQRPLPIPAPTLIDRFEDVDDLIAALVTSSYVPMYLAPRPVVQFRGEPHVDGGLAQPVPQVPGFVTVTMLPFLPADISPALLAHPPRGAEWVASLSSLIPAAFLPGTDGHLWDLYHWGYDCATAWLSSRPPPPTQGVAQ